MHEHVEIRRTRVLNELLVIVRGFFESFHLLETNRAQVQVLTLRFLNRADDLIDVFVACFEIVQVVVANREPVLDLRCEFIVVELRCDFKPFLACFEHTNVLVQATEVEYRF